MLISFSAIAVSRDHKPDQTDERQRIEDAGGFVMWAGKPFMLFSPVLVSWNGSKRHTVQT